MVSSQGMLEQDWGEYVGGGGAKGVLPPPPPLYLLKRCQKDPKGAERTLKAPIALNVNSITI